MGFPARETGRFRRGEETEDEGGGKRNRNSAETEASSWKTGNNEKNAYL